jgi:hypothetical protein
MLNGTSLRLLVDHTYIEHYNLGAEYCRKALSRGGVCIFVHEKLKFSNVNLNEFCKEEALEVYAVKLQFSFGNICILSIHRAPSGNFSYFLNSLGNGPIRHVETCPDFFLLQEYTQQNTLSKF